MDSKELIRLWGVFGMMLWLIIAGQEMTPYFTETYKQCRRDPTLDCKELMDELKVAMDVASDALCGFFSSLILVWGTFVVSPQMYVFCVVIEIARLRLRFIEVGYLNIPSVINLAVAAYKLYVGGFFNYQNYRRRD